VHRSPDGSLLHAPSLASVTPIAAERRHANRLARLDERAVRLLSAHCGPGWVDLPTDLGRTAAAAMAALGEAPTDLDGRAWAPGPLLHRASLLVAAAHTTVDLVAEEVDLLGEGLGADLAPLPLRRLLDLCGAVVDLSRAPSPPAVWGDPDSTRVAEVVVRSVGPEVRAAGQLHRRVYADFTDAVWDVPDGLLQRATQRRRLLSRLRLRRRLATVSRSGRAPGRLVEVATTLLEAGQARARVAAMASLLAGHLGHLDRGPMTDLDEVDDALAAVGRLQRALGDRLDPLRLRDLFRAEAFRRREVVLPAVQLVTAIGAWEREVTANGGRAPLEVTVGDLAHWADRLQAALPALAAGHRALAATEAGPTSAHGLVDQLVLREHLEDLARTTAADGRRSVS
jgi:hypothetical protein